MPEETPAWPNRGPTLSQASLRTQTPDMGRAFPNTVIPRAAQQKTLLLWAKLTGNVA